MLVALSRLKCLQRTSRMVLFTRSMCIKGTITRRINSHDNSLEEYLATKEPFGPFKAWFDEARGRTDIMLPNAMCLATATENGIPSARIVMCQEYDKNGFKFFTDLESRKSVEMFTNPYVAAIFHWPRLNRCVRIEGYVEVLSEEESTTNFYSQPIGNQIAASVSHQSSPIESRDILFERESALEQEHLIPARKIPKPTSWGGFIIRPMAVEFYQGQRDHLHDRIKFRRATELDKPDGKLLHYGEDGWLYERLSP